MAVDAVFNGEEYIAYRTIPECIDAVDRNDVDIAVVPLENAIEGTVHLTVDYLVHQVRLPIFAEIVVPIQQHLLTHKDFSGDLADITAIYSHTQAIAQCHQFIHQHIPQAQIHYTTSTARAAELVSESSEPIVAIGNKLSADEYGLRILRENIHDYPNNHTRFAVLAKEKEHIRINRPDHDGEKTTLLVTLPSDHAGALHQVLSAFAWRKMNLSKIESRPMKTGLGNYFFIIDVEMKADDVLIPGVKSELEALGCEVDIIGSYPCFFVK